MAKEDCWKYIRAEGISGKEDIWTRPVQVEEIAYFDTTSGVGGQL